MQMFNTNINRNTFNLKDNHVNLRRLFMKFPRKINQDIKPLNFNGALETNNDFCQNKIENYLEEFTNFLLFPTVNFQIEQLDSFKLLTEVWLNRYVEQLIAKSSRNQLTNKVFLDLQSMSALKSKLFQQWNNQMAFIEEFYLDFNMLCPVCLNPIEGYTFESNLISILLSHKCPEISPVNLDHHCPCGTFFDNHNEYLNHILPTNFNIEENLTLCVCPIATFYWLIIALSGCTVNQCFETNFVCKACENPNKEMDFFTFLLHLSTECCYFNKESVQDGDNSVCAFCPASQDASTRTISSFTTLKSPTNILNCLNTDFNLNLFQMIDFFDFSLDFNVAQKLRPSDFLVSSQLLLNVDVNNLQFNILDEMFLSKPYSCSKCLNRFKEISLKYNHNCLMTSNENKSNNDHLCRCGKIFFNHSEFWNHIFNQCMILSFLHFKVFCHSKKLKALKCFCENYSCKSISKFLEHWKICNKTYFEFLKSCKQCLKQQTSEILNFNQSSSILTKDCLPVNLKSSNLEKSNANSINYSPIHSSMSLVAKRCLNFTDNSTIEENSDFYFSKLKFATIVIKPIDESAYLIQSTTHLMVNIKSEIHIETNDIKILNNLDKMVNPQLVLDAYYKSNVCDFYDSYFNDETSEIIIDSIEIIKKSNLKVNLPDRKVVTFENKPVKSSNCLALIFKIIKHKINKTSTLPKSTENWTLKIDTNYVYEEDIYTQITHIKTHSISSMNCFKCICKQKNEHYDWITKFPMLPIFRKFAHQQYNFNVEDDTYQLNNLQNNFQLSYLAPTIDNNSMINCNLLSSVSEYMTFSDDVCNRELRNIVGSYDSIPSLCTHELHQ